MLSQVIPELIRLAGMSSSTNRHAAALVYGKKILGLGVNYDINDKLSIDIGGKKLAWPHDFNESKTENESIFDSLTIARLQEIIDEIRRKGLTLSCHAEKAAIDHYYNITQFKRKKCIKLSKTTLIVIRVNSSGQMVNSKPCKHCTKMLIFYGIKKIIYSNKNGELIKESITKKTYDDSQESLGFRCSESAYNFLLNILDKRLSSSLS